MLFGWEKQETNVDIWWGYLKYRIIPVPLLRREDDVKIILKRISKGSIFWYFE
jgi:hypothetical protein